MHVRSDRGQGGGAGGGGAGEAVLGRKVGETLVGQVAGCVCARVRVSGGLWEGQWHLHVREALRVRGLGCAPMSLSVALWLSERSSLCVSARGLCVCKRLCPVLWLYVPWLCPGECVRAMSVLGRHCGDNDGESWTPSITRTQLTMSIS